MITFASHNSGITSFMLHLYERRKDTRFMSLKLGIKQGKKGSCGKLFEIFAKNFRYKAL